MSFHGALALFCILSLGRSSTASLPGEGLSIFPRGRPHQPGTLFPAKHPDKDIQDVNNLKATTGTKLYYEEIVASQPHGSPMAAYIEAPAFNAPVVSVEHSAHIQTVGCDDPSTISVLFATPSAWKTAVDDWSQYIGVGGFYIMAYADGCGPGLASGERSFHLVRDFTSDRHNLSVTCKGVDTVRFHEAVHPEEKISLRMAQAHRKSISRRDVEQDINADADPENWFDFLQGTRDVSDEMWAARGDGLSALASGDGNSTFDPDTLEYLSSNTSQLVATPAQLETRGFGDIDETIKLRFVSQAMLPYNTTPWGVATGYTLFSNATSTSKKNSTSTKNGGQTKTSSSSDFGFGLYCLQCHAEFDLTGRIVVDWTIKNGISKALITLNGEAEMQLVLGLEAHYSFVYNIDKKLPIPKPSPFQVPGLFEFGPSLGIQLGAKLTIDIDGRIAAGYTYEWPAISATIDLLNSANSESSGWTPIQTPHFLAEVNLKVSFVPYIEFLLGLEVAVVPAATDKFRAGVYLGDRVNLDLGLALAVQADASGIKSTNPKCAGVVFTAKITGQLFLLAMAGTAKKKVPLFTHPVVNLADECVKIPGLAVAMRSLRMRQNEMSGDSQSAAYLVSTIDDAGTTVSILLDDDESSLRAILPPEAGDGTPFYSKGGAAYFVTVNGTEKTLVLFSDTLNTTGMSRCRMKAQDEIPIYGEFAAFSQQTASDGTPYGVVVSALGTYLPVICLSPTGQTRMYVVSGIPGFNSLTSNAYATLFTGGEMISQCGYVNLTASPVQAVEDRGVELDG